jgi:hypothetical protein
METTLLIKRYQIFGIVLSATLVGVSLTLGNAWAQERGLVIPELADVPAPANATNSTTIMKDNINASSPVTVVNKTIQVPSDIPNPTLESESPQSNNTANKSDS